MKIKSPLTIDSHEMMRVDFYLLHNNILKDKNPELYRAILKFMERKCDLV